MDDESDKRTLYDTIPMKRALQYVVQEAQKHASSGADDQFVAVGRVCHAVLKWQAADEIGDYDTAAEWLAKIPR